MAYLDSFIQPRPDNLTDLYKFVQSGYDAGKKRAQNERFAQLAQAAYNDTGDQQKADISQAIGIDPATGYRLADITQQRNAAALQAKQAILAKFGKGASAILQAKRNGDDAAAEGIYQSMLPDLRAFSAQMGGPEPPPDVEGGDMGALYKLATMYGSGLPAPVKDEAVAAGTTLINPITHQVTYSSPAKPQVDLQSGLQYDPATGTARPIPLVGAKPQAAPTVTPPATNAAGQKVAFNFAPGTPQAVIDAVYAGARADGAQPNAPTGANAQPATVGDYQTQRAAQLAAAKGGFNANHPQELGDPTLSGQAYLASIPANVRGTVLQVLQGRAAPPSGSAAKSSFWMGVINAANKIDPTFDTVDYQSRYKTAQSYAPGGEQGKQVIALNTMIQHINQLAKTYSQLGNGNSPLLNGIENKLSYATGIGKGRDAIKAYELNANAAAQEIESLWKKGGGNESDIALYRDKLSSSNDPATEKQVLGKMLDLALGRLQSLHSSYVNAMGSGATGKQFVTPQSMQVISTLAPDVAQKYSSNASAPATGQIANPQSTDPQLDALLKKYGGG